MLTFEQIGLQAFEHYVTYYILKEPSSTSAPVRRRKQWTQ